jgi:hypothetical protein
MNWSRLAIAAVLPMLAVLPVALALWRKQQPIVGNAIGALVLFMGFLFFGGSEYVDGLAYRKWCQEMNQPCPISDPSDFVKIMAFGIVTMVQIMGLFLVSDVVANRNRRGRAPQ